jgi:hypothetical protein
MGLSRRQLTQKPKLAAVRRLEQGVSVAEVAPCWNSVNTPWHSHEQIPFGVRLRAQKEVGPSSGVAFREPQPEKMHSRHGCGVIRFPGVHRRRPMRRSRSWNRGSGSRGSKAGRMRTHGLKRSA